MKHEEDIENVEFVFSDLLDPFLDHFEHAFDDIYECSLTVHQMDVSSYRLMADKRAKDGVPDPTRKQLVTTGACLFGGFALMILLTILI